MKIISRYILNEFSRIAIYTLTGFVLVFLVVDFLEKIDNFLAAGVPLTRAGYYFLMLTPSVIFHLTPVAVLVAVLIALGLLARNSEIIALKAGGVSLFRLAVPIVLAATLSSALIFVLSNTIIPFSSAEANTIWEIEVEKRREASADIHRDVWLRSGGTVLNLGLYNEKTRAIERISLYRLDEKFQLIERIEAESAQWIGDGWELRDGLVKTYLADDRLKVRHFEKESFDLPELPRTFAVSRRSAEEMSFGELAAWVRQMEAEGYDPLRYEVDLHMKLSFPFICTIMALIGLPIAFWKERGGGIALGIGVGIGLSFVYLVFLGLSRSLGYSGLVPAVVAAWMPNLIFTLLGLLLFTHVRQ